MFFKKYDERDFPKKQDDVSSSRDKINYASDAAVKIFNTCPRCTSDCSILECLECESRE